MDAGQRMVQSGFSKEAFPAGTHICQIFCDEQERSGAITDFLLAGVRDGARTACYLSDRLDPAALQARLDKHDLTLEGLEADGTLELGRAREVYFREGGFDLDRPFELLAQLQQDALKVGRPARAMGEVCPEVGQIDGGRPLLAYERRLNPFLREKRLMVVCQYEAAAFDGATIMDILKVHPMMVLRGEVVYNPFFVPADPLVSPERGVTSCPEVQPLGQILLIESLIAQLPNRLSMLRFAVRGLEDLPGVRKVWFQDGSALADEGGRHAFEIRYDGHCHAVLYLAVADEAQFAPYYPYLKNLAFMLGVVLGERLQREQNQRYRTQLEALVEARTQALLESEGRAQSMLRTALDGIWLVDAEDRLLEVNQAACAMLGYSHGELLGMRVEQIETQAGQPPLAGIRQQGSRLFESRHRRKDGTEFPVEVSGTFHLERNQVVVFVRDITERKRAQEALLQDFALRSEMEKQAAHARQMESLGHLAGGVAHDMNNVLGAILALATSYQQGSTADSGVRNDLDTIAKAAIRGGQMVKSLLNFARPAPMDEVAVDLNRVIQEVVGLLERTLLARIRLAVDLEPRLRPMRGDAGALAHSLLNLCINAVDAMPGEGTLTLRTRNLGEQGIEVQVRDTGAGMSAEVTRRALDPFFTTKGVGKGTGLGLAMVSAMAKAHQAQLAIQSEPGQGTCVTLIFPASQAASPAPGLAADSPKAAAAGFKVLLVDDDPLIQLAMGALLDRLGHAGTIAASGEEALLILEQGYRPEWVILDLNMPGLGGARLLPRLRAILPEVPVILATGKPDQVAHDLLAAYPGVTLLPKPFTMADLRTHLQQRGSSG